MPTTGLSAECSAELQGVRGKMLKMRAEVDAATEKADNLAKSLAETTERLHQTEEERNNLQRQMTNVHDQLFTAEGHLKDASDRLAESDSNREILLNEVKGLNHRLNMMDTAEETYKQQLAAERERATQYEAESAEFKRISARLEMDNEKLSRDVDMHRADNLQLMQQLKETEDRIVELTSSYNQVVMENKQLEHYRANGRHHHHEIRSINAAPPAQAAQPTQSSQEMAHKDRQLQASIQDLEGAVTQLNMKDTKISQLENEVYVYQENYRMLSDQLREVEQMNREMKQQASRTGSAQDQLGDAIEQNKVLNSQLAEAEKQNGVWEAKAAELKSTISQLQQQLLEQKAAYGELYSQMTRTIKDLEKEDGGVCDF